eukprot:6270146-Prymnesium_polylepis.1
MPVARQLAVHERWPRQLRHEILDVPWVCERVEGARVEGELRLQRQSAEVVAWRLELAVRAQVRERAVVVSAEDGRPELRRPVELRKVDEVKDGGARRYVAHVAADACRVEVARVVAKQQPEHAIARPLPAARHAAHDGRQRRREAAVGHQIVGPSEGEQLTRVELEGGVEERAGHMLRKHRRCEGDE